MAVFSFKGVAEVHIKGVYMEANSLGEQPEKAQIDQFAVIPAEVFAQIDEGGAPTLQLKIQLQDNLNVDDSNPC